MKNKTPVSEFKPALKFLLIFVGTYLVGNILYGLFVEYYKPAPDPLTILVTNQTAYVLTILEEPVQSIISTIGPIVALRNADRTVLNVFEGCNGLNVMIVFASFLLAFGGGTRRMMIFLFTGCLILHTANILRLFLLYLTAIHRPLYFYYFHKYFFTAVLYLVVFGLWLLWMRMNSRKREPVKA